VAVIHRPRYDDWSLPKGKLNPGEIPLEGAVREVAEETGYRVVVGRSLGEVHYIKDARPKVVHYWAMRSEGGMFTPTREVDQLRWLPVEEAHSLLTQARDRDLLARFAAGPRVTRSVLLVRHGSAGSRSDWAGDDDDRPLDRLGTKQADALIWLLTRFDIRKIASAPVLRCLQTVEPLSVAVGLQIQEEPLLAEDVYHGAIREAVALVANAGADGTGVVLCSQGGVIPDILQHLAKDAAEPVPKSLPSKKGSVWALTMAGDRLHSAEYFPPLV
jgi:8-oxo-dGTP diphosphatase